MMPEPWWFCLVYPQSIKSPTHHPTLHPKNLSDLIESPPPWADFARGNISWKSKPARHNRNLKRPAKRPTGIGGDTWQITVVEGKACHFHLTGYWMMGCSWRILMIYPESFNNLTNYLRVVDLSRFTRFYPCVVNQSLVHWLRLEGLVTRHSQGILLSIFDHTSNW